MNASERSAAAPGPTPPAPPPRLPVTSRLGLGLFLVYVLLYGGFMGLVLARPDLLALRPAGGMNLALIAGLGLIAAAFLLAVIYMLGRRDT